MKTKIHWPWKAAGWRTYCRVWGASMHGGRAPFRSIDQFTAAYKRRFEAALERHFAAGKPIVERETVQAPGSPTNWFLGKGSFIKPYCDDPLFLAEHVTNRAISFGWSITIQSP